MQTALSSNHHQWLCGYVGAVELWNRRCEPAPLQVRWRWKGGWFQPGRRSGSHRKALDESEWAAGYRVDLWFGPDANTLNTSSTVGGSGDFAIRQAYVALRTPVGNGLDWKVGVFDSILGYESVESGNNPNYTRSYGHSIEPQTQPGVLATYRFSDLISASAGVADTAMANQYQQPQPQ